MKKMRANVDLITEAMVKQGLTVLALAKRAKKNHWSVYSTLRGQSQGPRMIKALCDALGLSTEAIWNDHPEATAVRPVAGSGRAERARRT